jgi:hypothetical protein
LKCAKEIGSNISEYIDHAAFVAEVIAERDEFIRKLTVALCFFSFSFREWIIGFASLLNFWMWRMIISFGRLWT